MPSLTHFGETVGDHLNAEDDRGRPVLSEASSGEDSVPGMSVNPSGAGVWFPRDQPPDPSQIWEDCTVGGGSGEDPILPGLLLKYVRVYFMLDPGLQGGERGKQRTDSISLFTLYNAMCGIQ